jgi:DNA polymerase
MNILTIDFETYYSRDFSLSKMTTEEYIRSPSFEVIGVAVKVGGEDTEWFTGTYEQTKKFLQEFNWRDSLAIAHNAMFDAAILTWHFGIKPRGWIDTLSMARAIHGTEVGGSLATLARYYQLGVKGTEVVNALGKRRLDFSQEEIDRYGEYCINDVDLTYNLSKCLTEDFPHMEMRLIDLTIKMYSEPVLVLDKPVLEEHLVNVRKKKEELLSKVTVDRATLMSNPQFADTLTSLGVTPPTKISPTTGRETLALAKNDEEFKALAEHENPEVQALVAARLGTKSTLEETRTERFIGIAERGRMPVPLKYYAAHTGRWGGADNLNLQNLPRKSLLKHAIRAPQGYVMIDSDSSQIEARTLAWLAGQWDLVDAFTRGEDVYRIMASAIYGKPVEEITDSERFVGKTTILGAGYGMGAKKFQAQLKNFGVTLPEAEAQRIITVYRETYPQIPMLWKDCQRALIAIMMNQITTIGVLTVEGGNGVALPNGLYIKYPNLRIHVTPEGKEEFVYDTKKGKAVIPNRIYGGKVTENVCQALARIIIGEQMLLIARRYRVVMTVHDAIACIAPKEEAEVAKAFVEQCMRMRPDWCDKLPLNCEAGYGETYGSC